MATPKELDPLNQKAGMDPFNPPNQIGNALVSLSVASYWKAIEAKRVQDARKMYSWYMNEKDEIVRLTRLSMFPLFKRETILRMNLRVLNVVERVVSKLAMVYKEPAERMLDGGKKTVVELPEPGTGGDQSVGQSHETTKTVQTGDDVTFQGLLSESTIGQKATEWNKLGKLFNTVLVEPVWRADPDLKNGGFVDFTIHTPAFCLVETDPDDFLRPRAFAYTAWALVKGRMEQVFVCWDDARHFMVDRMGNTVAPPENPGLVNPYQTLPAAVLRFKEGGDFWGEGLWDLVDANEEVAIQLSNLGYVAILQGHGQAVAVNMNLPANTVVGPDRPIVVDKVPGTSDMAAPSFRFENANAPLEKIQAFIDWLVKSMQATKGLAASSFSLEAVVASGVSKNADNADVQEIREGDVPALLAFEKVLFRKVRAVYNYHTKGAKISEKAEFSIKFGESKVLKSVDEKNKEREFGLKNKTLSRIDIIMEDNPGLTREQAQEKLLQIIAEERQIEDKFGLLDALEKADGSAGGRPGAGDSARPGSELPDDENGSPSPADKGMAAQSKTPAP